MATEMKEYSTCMNCRDSYQIDFNLPDALWNKIVAKQTPDVEIKLCPMCIGYLIHKYSKSENVSGAFKLVDLVNAHSSTKDGQLVSEAMDVLRHCKTHFDLFTPHDEAVVVEMIIRLESHATELDRVREVKINEIIDLFFFKPDQDLDYAITITPSKMRKILTNQLTKEDKDESK